MPDENLALDAGSTALMLLDFQPMVVGTLADEQAATTLACGKSLVDKFRPAGAPIVFVRLALSEDDYGRIPPSNLSLSEGAKTSDYIREDQPHTAYHPDLAPVEGDIQVRKTRVGAFANTGLMDELRDLGVDTIVMGGLHTSRVVLSSFTFAADQDFRCVVVPDLCADPDSHLHDMLLGDVFPRTGIVRNSSQIELVR